MGLGVTGTVAYEGVDPKFYNPLTPLQIQKCPACYYVMHFGASPSRKHGVIAITAGLVITIVLGSSYAYSVFIKPLASLWGSVFWASLPFSVLIATFAISGIFGGWLYVEKGIRAPALLSMSLTSTGLLLSSLVEVVSSPIWLILTYGVLVGLGNGTGYLPVVALARKWYPDRAGFATGIVIFGYGGSALAVAPLKAYLIELAGVGAAFATLGLISILMGIPAAVAIRDPPAGLVEHYSKFARKRIVLPKKDFTPAEALKTIDFWLLWASFILVSGAGLMLIGHMAHIAELRGVQQAPLAVSIFALMNALGRPPAGWISDRLGKFGRPVTMTVFFAAQGLLLYLLATPWTSSTELFFLVIAMLGYFYGSALALYPAATGDFFGIKYLSENYSLVFTGWGISGLLFPSICSYIVDLTRSYEPALILSSALSATGAIMCLYLKKRLALYLY